MPSGRVRVAIGAGVVVLAAALLVPLLLLDSSPLRWHTPPVPPAPSVGSSTSVAQPPTGAYVGAWVKPTKYSEQGHIEAVESFEGEVGRKLDIVHNYHTWEDYFPNQFDRYVTRRGSTLLLSWAGTDTRDIAAGKVDGVIRMRARALKELGGPVLLEWRWEMDRPNLRAVVHDPEDYIAAWKRIRSLFHDEGADRVDWVWCPTAEGFAAGRAGAYYPGDSEVDWICVDAYALTPAEPLADELRPFLDWARGHDKPVIIGEFGTQTDVPGRRAAWLADVAATVRAHPQVKALLYFDSNIDRDGKKRYWSLRNSAEDVQAFGRLMAQPYFNPRKLPTRD
ncbi:MAG: glycoside hydrolase family 26 protein [Mycobacteriales bacterium]